jgi:hypothetical protein
MFWSTELVHPLLHRAHIITDALGIPVSSLRFSREKSRLRKLHALPLDPSHVCRFPVITQKHNATLLLLLLLLLLLQLLLLGLGLRLFGLLLRAGGGLPAGFRGGVRAEPQHVECPRHDARPGKKKRGFHVSMSSAPPLQVGWPDGP